VRAPGCGLALAAALALFGASGDDGGGDGGAGDGGLGGGDAAPRADGASAPHPDADPSAPPGAAVTINELMVANRLTRLSPGGFRADWVELYNAGDADVPLAGFTLTDDLATPGKRPLPDGAVVPARGHLLVWLEGTGFELAREGGALGLARADGTWVDRVTYGAQAVDLSAARRPDGGRAWEILWEVTPGGANPDGPGPLASPEDAAAPPEAIPGAGDVSERVLGDDVRFEVELRLPEASFAALRVEPYVYVPGSVVYRGRELGPVGVRLKGQNSFSPIDEKPSFKVKIDAYVPGAELCGLENLTLDNMHSDPSMIHERLAYAVARAAGVPASRSNHALVTVNGELYGVYAHVETVQPRFIGRWFADRTGSLFEGAEVDFVTAQVPGFELEGGADDRTKLYALADALELPAAEAIPAAAEIVDLQQFRRFWAMCSVIAQFDSLPFSLDDYHLYLDPTSARFHFIPWGMDETFHRYWRDPTIVLTVLAQRCLEHADCRAQYVAEAWHALEVAEGLDLPAMIDRFADDIAPWVALDLRKPYTDADVAAHQDEVRDFVAKRRATLFP
jgi:hypothetical protein